MKAVVLFYPERMTQHYPDVEDHIAGVATVEREQYATQIKEDWLHYCENVRDPEIWDFINDHSALEFKPLNVVTALLQE